MSKEVSKFKSAPFILSVILIMTVLLSVIFIIADRSKNDALVTIHSCGETVWTGNLESISGEMILTIVPSQDGSHPLVIEGVDTSYDHYNIVRITSEGVCVTESDCKNRICIHQGTISAGDLPIACLPNRLLITVSPGEGNSIDAYTY